MLLIIAAAIIISGAAIRLFFGFWGHIIVALGIIVGILALYNYIDKLKDTIERLEEKNQRLEEENKNNKLVK